MTLYKCESEWHEEIILKNFQRCPICMSESHHSEKGSSKSEEGSSKSEDAI